MQTIHAMSLDGTSSGRTLRVNAANWSSSASSRACVTLGLLLLRWDMLLEKQRQSRVHIHRHCTAHTHMCRRHMNDHERVSPTLIGWCVMVRVSTVVSPCRCGSLTHWICEHVRAGEWQKDVLASVFE
jgi:hypothetical protein